MQIARKIGALCSSVKSNATASISDYVSDGLISLLDGEYNQGTSNPRAESATWKNCSPQGSAVSIDGTYSWGSNYVTIGEFTQPTVTFTGLQGDPATIEIVYSVDTYHYAHQETSDATQGTEVNTDNYGVVIMQSTERSSRYRTTFDEVRTSGVEIIGGYGGDVDLASVAAYVGLHANGNGVDYAGTNAEFERLSTIKSVSFALEYATASINLNGRAGGIQYDFPAIADTYKLNALSTYDTAIRYYCIRAYNRRLSDTERLQNYNVDRLRFGVL